MENDLSNLKVGDYVWHFSQGWSKIIYKDSLNITVKNFQNIEYSYWLTGKVNKEDPYPTVFKIPPVNYAELKRSKFTKGDRVLVKDYIETQNSMRRYFSHMNRDGKYCCFKYGKTAWSQSEATYAWKYCKEADDVL